MANALPVHSKIAWAGQTGFHGATYCCFCSYSTREKPVTHCSEKDCPNSVCQRCFAGDDFSCTQTGELRRLRYLFIIHFLVTTTQSLFLILSIPSLPWTLGLFSAQLRIANQKQQELVQAVRHKNLDAMMVASHCEKVVIIGDLNQCTGQNAYNTVLVVHNLRNHVTFPTHSSGSSLDPVVADLPSHFVQCSPLDFVGSSNHMAVLTKVHFRNPREESHT
ncbi:hypothetical protein E2C01_055372 [Portunus trituberculatus]|uniref:Endonuclease/exonuclease/phosphatase domain-containing protein n=1 Tax=Portunus trituberculatus TaxID=210409 RepID=A0A5B7GUJ6_PORTR|nr:hypothetical protein [Portunus trituberculatus]